ncbi:MAG: sulfur carrier protein ThiS [Candidimonas sp.]|nr:MAG: sulfur carrier protein ThiS [Candidimonas sp.]
MHTISVTVNGAEHTVAAATTLRELLGTLRRDATAAATAVNGNYVARESRGEFILNDRDAITTFEPITGG